MSKALKTIGMIAGAVALIASGLGVAGIPAIAGASTATIATVASATSARDCIAFEREKPMTLQNGFVCGSRVNLYADTAWLELPTMKVRTFASKVFEGLRWPFAVSTSFRGFGGEGLLALGNRLDLDDPRNPAELLASVTRGLQAFHFARPDTEARALVGAWDQGERRATLHMIGTHDLGFARPFEPAGLSSIASSGNDLPTYRDGCARGWTQQRMLAQIDAQRTAPFNVPGFADVMGIGGNAVEYSVGRTGMRAQVVREWGDQVGLPIGAKVAA